MQMLYRKPNNNCGDTTGLMHSYNELGNANNDHFSRASRRRYYGIWCHEGVYDNQWHKWVVNAQKSGNGQNYGYYIDGIEKSAGTTDALTLGADYFGRWNFG